MAAWNGLNLTRLTRSFLHLQPASHLKFNKNVGVTAFFHRTSIFNVEGQLIKMPSLSPTMMEGTIVKWLKKEGDAIQPGDVICDIQTDKAVVSFEMDEEGILAKILIPEDTKDIAIGTSIAVMVEEGEDWQNVTIPESSEVAPDSSTSVTPSKPAASITSSSTVPATGSFGPSVRLLLEKYGLGISDVPHSGPHGRLVKGDILKLVKEKNLSPQPIISVAPPKAKQTDTAPTPSKPAPAATVGDAYTDIELTSMRRTIAKRLTQSKSEIPHSYVTLECRLDDVLNLRKRLKSEGAAVSVNDIIIKAVATALAQCPEINSVWQGDQLVQQNTVDVSVAVATDSGLITPIVKNADKIGFEEIAAQVRDLAGRARIGKLKLNEFQGGTFTISNLGMFGISEFSAIINPPQCAILAVGGGISTVGLNGQIETKMRAKLSYDRSAIDDDVAASFMKVLTDLLEQPNTILLGPYNQSVDHPLAALL